MYGPQPVYTVDSQQQDSHMFFSSSQCQLTSDKEIFLSPNLIWQRVRASSQIFSWLLIPYQTRKTIVLFTPKMRMQRQCDYVLRYQRSIISEHILSVHTIDHFLLVICALVISLGTIVTSTVKGSVHKRIGINGGLKWNRNLVGNGSGIIVHLSVTMRWSYSGRIDTSNVLTQPKGTKGMRREVGPPVSNKQCDEFVIHMGLSTCVGTKPVMDVRRGAGVLVLRDEREPPIPLPPEVPEGPSHLFNSEEYFFLVLFSSCLTF